MTEKEFTQEQTRVFSEVEKQRLVPDKDLWFPVTVSSRKHGGGLYVASGQPIRAEERPADTRGDTKEMEFKTRYFSSLQEAQRIMGVIQSLNITAERMRISATQGEVKIFINGKYILNFGDRIVLLECRANPEDYYGDDIGGWRSSEPDSGFVLGVIWHPFDCVNHISERVRGSVGLSI